MASVASLLAVDRTTLTAALKPLERRGLVKVASVRSPDRFPGVNQPCLVQCGRKSGSDDEGEAGRYHMHPVAV
jgi:hypothetical protein